MGSFLSLKCSWDKHCFIQFVGYSHIKITHLKIYKNSNGLVDVRWHCLNGKSKQQKPIPNAFDEIFGIVEFWQNSFVGRFCILFCHEQQMVVFAEIENSYLYRNVDLTVDCFLSNLTFKVNHLIFILENSSGNPKDFLTSRTSRTSWISTPTLSQSRAYPGSSPSIRILTSLSSENKPVLLFCSSCFWLNKPNIYKLIISWNTTIFKMNFHWFAGGNQIEN